MADGGARVPEVLTTSEFEGFIAGVMGPELLEPKVLGYTSVGLETSWLGHSFSVPRRPYRDDNFDLSTAQYAQWIYLPAS